MPLPTTFAGDSSRGAGQWTGSYGAPPIGGPYTIQSWQDTQTWTPSSGSTGPQNFVNKVAVDASGNVYSVGQAKNSSVYSLIVNKQSSSGTLSWSVGISLSGGYGQPWLLVPNLYFANQSSLTLDSLGNVYVCGSTSSLFGANVIKLNSSGAIQWSYTLSSGGASIPANGSYFSSIIADASGNVYCYYVSGY